jgi:hypothetical protein
MSEQNAHVEEASVAAWQTPTVQVEKIFDVAAALRLREAIARVPPDRPVLLDFSHTRECHDFALAALVHAVATMGRTGVMTRGLSEHHHRILRYLGRDPAQLS